MNDTPWNDAGATAPPEPAPARQPRQQRKPKAEAAPKVRKPRAALIENAPLPEAAVERLTRAAKKLRKPKVERAALETIKVSIKDYAQMRVGDEATAVFLKIHKMLSDAPKSQRTKILVEIGKVFG